MESKTLKALNNVYLEAVYGQSAGQELAKREKDDNAAGAPRQKKKMVVTAADKKANTPAYQNYKKGDKRYTAASHLGEEELQEKQKDTPDQVKAVIAFDKARKGTDDATYDSEHGKKKQAKKERDYAKWQRDKGAEDAQKSGHPWEHAKGSTREKEGKKSEKHAHIKDSYVQAYVSELNKTTLGSYVKKASKDLSDRRFDQGDSEKRKYDPDEYDDKEEKKLVQREKGISRAATKLVKKESFSNWRNDLVEYTNIVDEPESKADKKVKESNVKNKVVIDPEVKLEQALGGKVEVIEEKCGCDCGEVPCITCGGDHHAESKENKVKEEILWDRVAIALTELGEMNDVQFKVVVSEGQVKKELKDLSKASKTLKGKYVAKADEVEEEIQYLLTILTEAEIGDILARLEKKRISKGGNPDDSPLPAMKKYHADKKKKKVKEDYWNEFEEGYQRDPEGGEEKARQQRRSQKGGDRTEKVRGERTPMPPRGDKRREDFERWYAANVR